MYNIDHLGNEYKSQREMCKAYNISEGTFRSRIKLGFTVEQSLTWTANQLKGYTCKDGQGNEYTCQKEMCNALNIKENTFSSRKKHPEKDLYRAVGKYEKVNR